MAFNHAKSIVIILTGAINVINPSSLHNYNDLSNYYRSHISRNDFLCNPLFCSRIICPEIIDCPFGQIVPFSSICGCCEKCISYLDENEPCKNRDFTPYAEQPDKCKVGLKCKNGFCVKSFEENCQSIAKHRMFLRDQTINSNVYSKTLWIPECDVDGKFKAKQCKEKKCLCVDENGKSIFGQEESELAENMTCGCSRAMNHLRTFDQEKWLIKVQEHCTYTGDYDLMQCIGDICFCCNSTTGEVIGRVTKMPFRNLLPCYDKKINGHRYERQCELQLMTTRSLNYQFYRKNILIIGLEHVRCDVDGTFAAKQCQTDRCTCTDRKGIGIKSYYIEKDSTEREVQMKCNCARDEYDRETIHSRYPRLICDRNGNFVSLQCFNLEECYCVDEDGDAITKKLSSKQLQDNKCKHLLEILHSLKSITTTPSGLTDDYEYSDDYEYL